MTSADTLRTEDRPGVRLPTLWRGARCRCPRCGRGRVLHSYLKVREACAVCGTRFGHLRVDDGAAWLALSLVGLLVFPALMYVEIAHQPDVTLTIIGAVLAALVLTLVLLPVSKGIILAVLWALERKGNTVPDQ
ncbi:hypothetical protein C882_3135 [Caenispirillum salinarum AK4]|uniref:DUF983 domain-containing protein n=1 Tax=Caenispirillum salinarum AK4 TaxID=1238182 RepID=K9HUY5_9PROT|nr:DUF983 domain-containing protein [Caenispirillum salinarum]EKV32071.1 hypothetical protein C882_3135 [Caenispirillum salinarum AK4]